MEFHKASAPEPSGTSQGICTGTLRNLTKHLLRQNTPEPHKVSAPEPSGTSQGICPGTLRNLTAHLHLDPPEPHQVPAPSICIVTLRNLTEYLHRKLPEPHKVSAQSSLSRYLHRNPLEPHELSAPEPPGTSRGICTRTLRNLVRSLMLKLHRVAPELIWAKDTIAKFCCWGTKRLCHKNYSKCLGCLGHKKHPNPFGISQSICTRTLRNLTTHLHLDPPEPHQVAAPETSGTSPGTCTKTL